MNSVRWAYIYTAVSCAASVADATHVVDDDDDDVDTVRSLSSDAAAKQQR